MQPIAFNHVAAPHGSVRHVAEVEYGVVYRRLLHLRASSKADADLTRDAAGAAAGVHAAAGASRGVAAALHVRAAGAVVLLEAAGAIGVADAALADGAAGAAAAGAAVNRVVGDRLGACSP